MIRTTPFHERTSALNETGLWQHWSGHVVVTRYQASDKFEYFAVRNSAGIFDTSPLYKYRIAGRDAERFLSGMLARDIRRCPPRNAHYTTWLDERGFVLEDGVIQHRALGRVPPDLGGAELRLVRRPGRPAGRDGRGGQPGHRHAGGAGPALARPADAPRPVGGRAALLRPDERAPSAGGR